MTFLPRARRSCALLLVCVGAALFPGMAHAFQPQQEEIVIDARSGKVLLAKNPDARTYPASLTKMMTLYLLFDALSHGKVTLATPLVMSQHGANQAPSRLGINPGESLTVEQAILAIVTKSANDVAVAIGERLGGSEQAFAVRMTETAHRLGMRSTEFKNASGLPNLAQHTTARDMATLSLALRRDYPQYYHYFSVREFAWGNDVIPSHNRVLLHYPGADGLKTGFIAASGFNLATSATRDSVRLVGVVMGGTTGASRDQEMMKLLDKGFEMASKGPSAKASEAVAVATPPAAITPKVAATSKTIPVPAPAALVAALDDAPDAAWGILVGTYPSKVSAKHEAASAAAKLSAHGDSNDLKSAVVKASFGKQTVYKAEVIGFDKQAEATKACHALRKAHIGQPKACVTVAPVG